MLKCKKRRLLLTMINNKRLFNILYAFILHTIPTLSGILLRDDKYLPDDRQVV